MPELPQEFIKRMRELLADCIAHNIVAKTVRELSFEPEEPIGQAA